MSNVVNLHQQQVGKLTPMELMALHQENEELTRIITRAQELRRLNTEKINAHYLSVPTEGLR